MITLNTIIFIQWQGSIWSSKLDDIKNYPFEKFVSFFSNHGLLKIFNRPKWRTVKGGSRSYVQKILNNNKIKFYKIVQ